MAELEFKTRGMVSPRGKTKIYFCCHPDDFEQYFYSISTEILSKYDCAIFYCKDHHDDDDEKLLQSDLSQMQLFVMPITRRLLESSNRAIDTEFAYTRKMHIPVLPLMQEKGLEKLFNRRCGNVQFLDKYSEDLSAISYEEKLSAFLDSVLIGDELTQKVKAAFHAYIFLSYRKKDRKLARQLMDLIHCNENCWNMAIWYDEFLIPGENFNSAIEKALLNCDLFAMAVTPSLLEKENYVQSIEYPMACNYKKNIMPVEMKKTDRDQLQRMFPQLPEPIDVTNCESVQEALSTQLRTIAITPQENDPEHDFFVGLAYLHGIDVEINYNIALNLIHRAAKNGVAEAVEKLVEIYDKGIGVQRNTKEAILWQRASVEIWRERYEKEKTEAICDKLFDKTIYLANMIARMNGIQKAAEWYDRAKQLADDLTVVFGNLPVALYLAYHHQGLASIHFADAKANLEKSLDILLQIIQKDPSAVYRRCLVSLYSQLGREYDQNPTGIIPLGKTDIDRDHRYFQQVWDQADEYYRCCISTAKELAVETRSIVDLRTLIEAHKKVARHYHSFRNDKMTAISHYRQCLQICKTLVAATDDLQDARNVIDILNRLGSMHELIKERELAKQYYKEALEYAQSLALRTQNIAVKQDVSDAYNTYARMYRIERKQAEEFACYDKELSIKWEIVKESNTYENCKSLAFSYLWYGRRCSEQGDAEKANELLSEALNLATSLLKTNDSPERVYELSSIYDRYAYYNTFASPSERKKCLQIAIDIWDKLFSEDYIFVELVGSSYDNAKKKLKELD